MTEEINPSELGAFTNNLSNKEGIKKLIKAVEDNTSDIATKQDKLTAGSNVAISDQNVISATDTKYTAGTNIAISDENVISATDTVYTAGTGISISEQNVISASGGDSNVWTSQTITSTNFDNFFYKPSESSSYYRCIYDCIVSIQPDRNDTSGGSYGDNGIYPIFIPKDSNFLFESSRILGEWFKIGGPSPSWTDTNTIYSTLFKIKKSSQGLRATKTISTITLTIDNGNIVLTRSVGSETNISADFYFKMPPTS